MCGGGGCIPSAHLCLLPPSGMVLFARGIGATGQHFVCVGEQGGRGPGRGWEGGLAAGGEAAWWRKAQKGRVPAEAVKRWRTGSPAEVSHQGTPSLHSLRLLVPRLTQDWEEAALRPDSPPLAGTSTGSVLVFDVPSKGTNITLSEVLEQHSSPITDICTELCEQPVRPEGASLSPPPPTPSGLPPLFLVIFKLPRGSSTQPFGPPAWLSGFSWPRGSHSGRPSKGHRRRTAVLSLPLQEGAADLVTADDSGALCVWGSGETFRLITKIPASEYGTVGEKGTRGKGVGGRWKFCTARRPSCYVELRVAARSSGWEARPSSPHDATGPGLQERGSDVPPAAGFAQWGA